MNKKHKQRRERERKMYVGKWETIPEEAQLISDPSDLFIVGCDRERQSPGQKYSIAYLCDALEGVTDLAFGDTEVKGQYR